MRPGAGTALNNYNYDADDDKDADGDVMKQINSSSSSSSTVVITALLSARRQTFFLRSLASTSRRYISILHFSGEFSAL